MKPSSMVIHGWAGLEQLGVNCLTGESCRYSMRLLCDLNQAGRELMVDYLGLGAGPLARPWNSAVDGKPSVASIMLHCESLPQLAKFALFRAGALAVLGGPSPQDLMGLFENQLVLDYTEFIARQTEQDGKSWYSLWRNHGLDTAAPHLGSRNVHAISGRSV